MEQQKVQMDQLVEERDRLAGRLKDLDGQIETLRAEQNQRADARLDDLLKGIRKSSSKIKKGGEGKAGNNKDGPGTGAKPAAPASTVVKSSASQ
jgi:chromosome segregation ATPase